MSNLRKRVTANQTPIDEGIVAESGQRTEIKRWNPARIFFRTTSNILLQCQSFADVNAPWHYTLSSCIF